MNKNIQTDEIEYESYRRKKIRKPKKKHGKVFLGLIVMALSIIAMMMSPIFTVKDVIVSDTLSKHTSTEICDITAINEGINIFALNKSSSIKAIKESPYIESVEIIKKLPSTVYINVLERKVRGYVPYMGSYLYIDEHGRVLEIEDFFTEPLPVVKGLEFDNFQFGEKIDAANKDALDVVVIISQVMTKYDMLDLVVNLDVSNVDNITARVNKVDVNLGTISNCDEKIRTMAAIINEIPEDDRGTLDLSDLSKPLVFKYLT